MYFGKMIFDSVKIKVFNGFKNIYKNESIANKSKLVNNYLKTSSSYFFEDHKFYLDGNNQIIIIGTQENNSFENIGFQTDVYIPSPIIVAQGEIFNDSFSIKIVSNYIKNIEHKSKIMVKINRGNYMVYHQPFLITKNTIVKTYEILDSTIIFINRFKSFCDTSTAHFYKKPNDYSIKINSTYNPQYTADGDEGIIDGLRGDIDWRKGRWQGYQNQDFEAIVDLKKETTITEVAAGFLQDCRSWILMPKEISIETSMDGKIFKYAGSIINTVADTSMQVQIKDLILKLKPTKALFVKIKAINYGKLPQWHQGFGGDAFIFVDEITIK